ncbi:Sodium, potassium, lithium and rubidium/H(+) antiporter [Methylobacterium crusticola]|uniref:Sodium, potassium, lithium and rubidium/H(+) antiporter n=1 Tax=Methylobacterium crusticola TaxID=1697972 RepID=A0ABQ4QTG8_9HYPH|nr:Na+/H+ antiporter [Methylobacterium crusticola]GJD48627.1 Sodium, potassium, lithium and rubidium/H(+) antiporter [Methylobacterium crusticola]
MTPVATFEFILLLLVAILGLEVLAHRTRLPPAAALIVGGIALAFVPGIPAVSLDPDLVLVLFLPPLLMDGAYFTVWSDFRRHLGGILSLAVGAVAFTTLVVGVVAHLLVPALPWAACFALGAVVSPPDAVAAKAVLARVSLPRRLMVLLEGESLLNDAAGLVLFRFAVAAALTGTFSIGAASLAFGLLALGGIAVGAVVGFAWVKLLRFLEDVHLIIAASFLLPWAAYVGGEAVHVSGVIATVTAGLIYGWYQHDILTADVRLRGTAFWKVMIFLMESFVFVLIGLSLRGVVARFGGPEEAVRTLALPVSGVVAAVILSRFAWVFGTDVLAASAGRIRGRRGAPASAAASAVMSWAGMRGVVTLAIALSLPEAMPGRDLILAAAFAVILVTVLLQGTTIGPLIRVLAVGDTEGEDARHLSPALARSRMAQAQLAVVERLSRDADGVLRHPRLLEQYGHRARVAARFSQAPETFAGDRADHYRVLLATIAAGRAEILRLHRSGAIHDETLHALEHDLDLQEMTAETARS